MTEPETASRRRLRRPAIVVLIGLVTVVLFELVLQLLALGVWFFQDDEARVEGRTVLCMGDSFTAGFGATNSFRTYPAVLEKILDERASEEWSVATRAMPGWCSRDVLERVDEALRETQPAFVYILVGVNDTWARPKELVLGDAPKGDVTEKVSSREPFRWELRTLRLFRTARARRPFQGVSPEEARAAMEQRTRWLARYQGKGIPEADRRLFGRWRNAFEAVVLRGDGTGSYLGAAALWRTEGDVFRSLAANGAAYSGRYELAGDQLKIRWDGASHTTTLTRAGDVPVATFQAPSNLGFAVVGRVAWRLGDLALARRMLERACAIADRGSDYEAECIHYLLRVLVRSGARPAIEARVARLKEFAGQRDDPGAQSLLVEGLLIAERIDAALAAATAATEAFPDDDEVWWSRAKAAWRAGKREEARTAIDRAIAQCDMDVRKGDMHVLRYRICAGHDEEEALRSVIQTYLLDRGESWHSLVHALGRFERPTFERVLRECVPDADKRAEIDAMMAKGRSGTSSIRDGIYRSHLQQLVRRCRDAGAKPVLSSYPHRGGWYREIAQDVAQTLGATWIDHHVRFVAELAKKPEAELFIADGHCNDAGYRLMAETVAADLLQRLGR